MRIYYNPFISRSFIYDWADLRTHRLILLQRLEYQARSSLGLIALAGNLVAIPQRCPRKTPKHVEFPFLHEKIVTWICE